MNSEVLGNLARVGLKVIIGGNQSMVKRKADFNKFMTGALTATLVAAAVVPMASASAFMDIGKYEASVQAEINEAVELGLFKDAKLFNPGAKMTRKQAALTVARHIAGESSVKDYVLEHDLESKVTPFDDVPVRYKNGAEYEQELYYASLVVKEMKAFTQKELNPAGHVTRAQMAKIIAQSFAVEKTAGYTSDITDIEAYDPQTQEYIQAIASNGITKVKTFNPAGHVTRAQMASFLVRASHVVDQVPSIQQLVTKFSADKAFADIQTLTDLGPRVTGTAAEKETLALIKKRVEAYGYEVSEQEFEIPEGKESVLTVSGTEMYNQVATNSATTETGGVTAELFFAKFGEAEDFTDEVKGKIALIARGGGVKFTEKVDHAQTAGAVGVIIYDNVEKEEPLKYTVNEETTIPAVGVDMTKGEELSAKLADGSFTEAVTIEVISTGKRTSGNIIATKYPDSGKKDGDIVYITAHIDSVPGAPGANDNGSGTAAALEMARVMKDYPIDKELRIAFVGAEEIGLVGSRHYVKTLSEQEIARSIADFNMDMVATAWENATAIYTNTVDGEPNIVTESANKVAELIGTPSELVLFKRGSSDHVSFDEVSIPSANFIRREPGTHNLEPYYHNKYDTMEHVSKDRLKEMIDLVGGAVYSVVKK